MMEKGEFRSPLRVEVTVDHKYPGEYVLTEQFVYYSPVLGGQVVVPAGFKTDFASIPKSVLDIPGFIGHRAATIHDYLVRNWTLEKRRTADTIFYEALLTSGVESDVAYLMYSAVDIYTDQLRAKIFTEPDDKYIA